MKNSNDKINDILKVVFVFTTNPSLFRSLPFIVKIKFLCPYSQKILFMAFLSSIISFPLFGDKTTVTFSCVLSLYLLTAFQYRF